VPEGTRAANNKYVPPPERADAFAGTCLLRIEAAEAALRIYAVYMRRHSGRHRNYMAGPLSSGRDPTAVGQGGRMFDALYLLVGAVFLGGAILYAYGCEHL